MATLEIRADGRAQELLTVDEMLLVIEAEGSGTFDPKSLRILVEMVSKFVWEGDGYLPFEQARLQVGKLNIRQLTDAARSLFAETAVPNPNGGASPSPSSTARPRPRAGSSASTRRRNGGPRPGK